MQLFVKYSYLSDGTRTETRMSDGTSIKYRGSFVFRTGADGRTVLESIAYDGGRLVAENRGGETVRLRDLWHVRDHLGSVRAVVDISEHNGATDVKDRLLEENDYMAFGTRFSPYPGAPAMSDNRYRYGGKEDQSFAGLPYIDYGARMYDPYAARWNATDPMAYVNISYSTYLFCSDNPICRVDENGQWDVSVHVYKSRNEYGYGIAIVSDRHGNEVYRFRVRAEGVNGRDRYKTGADTPLGKYTIPKTVPWIVGGSRISYGPNPRLAMEGTEGEIVSSGRNSIRIHGGRQEYFSRTSGKWIKVTTPELRKTYGCLRALDSDMLTFKQVTDNLEKNDDDEFPGSVTITDDLRKIVMRSEKNSVEFITVYEVPASNPNWREVINELINLQ